MQCFRAGEGAAERGGHGSARGVDIDQCYLCPGHGARKVSHQCADHTTPDHNDAVTGSNARIPKYVQCRFHVGGKDGAFGWHIIRQKEGCVLWNPEPGLVREQRKD